MAGSNAVCRAKMRVSPVNGVVNTRTSYTVVDSNKPLAEGSDKVSQAIETGNRQDRQQRWVAVRGW